MAEEELKESAGDVRVAENLESLTAMSAYIYIAELVSAFGDRMWQFAIPILFLDVWPNSLLPTILYTFSINLAMFILLPIAGSYVDSASRLPLMMASIIVDNIAVALTCIILNYMSYLPKEAPEQWIFFGIILAVSIPGELMVNVGRIALEKDWVPVVALGCPQSLSVLNSRLKIIDLSCKFVAPMAFGFILQLLGEDSKVRLRWGSGIVLLYNFLTIIPEGVCIARLYSACPKLATEKKRARVGDKNPWKEFYNGWKLFNKHPICLASYAFSILFTTVLSPGSLLIAFLKWVGVMEGLLGGSIGMGALFGLLGAYIFPLLYGKKKNGDHWMSLSQIGILSVWLWFFFLFPIAVIVFLRTEDLAPLSSYAMGHVILFFVVTGRTWLWVFDLAENQLLVERVSPDIRGRISGVQGALCQFFTVLIYALGLIFHRPEQFYILCCASVASVFMSAVLFTIWFHKFRDPREFEEAVPLTRKTLDGEI